MAKVGSMERKPDFMENMCEVLQWIEIKIEVRPEGFFLLQNICCMSCGTTNGTAYGSHIFAVLLKFLFLYV